MCVRVRACVRVLCACVVCMHVCVCFNYRLIISINCVQVTLQHDAIYTGQVILQASSSNGSNNKHTL